jgi:hypothetical protein
MGELVWTPLTTPAPASKTPNFILYSKNVTDTDALDDNVLDEQDGNYNGNKDVPDKGSPRKDNDERFYEWLAGIIDGDGCFLLSKKGYASLEIVTQLRDKKCLYLIKQNFGGSVKLTAGDNYLRYRLHHKAGLINLIDKVNGLIQNPIRILQLGRICRARSAQLRYASEKYNIELKEPKALTYYNGWLAGFIDTDGSIYLNDASGQMFITAVQKNRFMLDALVKLYGGTIYRRAPPFRGGTS